MNSHDNNEYLLTEKDIRKVIEEEADLTIYEETEDGLFLIDDEDCKQFQVHFLEHMNAQRLAELIHISSAIPVEYRPDKQILADYLWNTCDKNAFVTLNELVIFWDDDGWSTDPERERLYNEHSDEFALELAAGYLGQLWFDCNIVAVNMRVIVDTSSEIAKENEDLYSPYFEFEHLVTEGLLTTALHELRHLQMDTNIFLPEDVYPLSLNAEKAVEEYGREVYEINPVPFDIISFQKEPLSEQIQAAASCAAKEQAGTRSFKPGPDLNR